MRCERCQGKTVPSQFRDGEHNCIDWDCSHTTVTPKDERFVLVWRADPVSRTRHTTLVRMSEAEGLERVKGVTTWEYK